MPGRRWVNSCLHYLDATVLLVPEYQQREDNYFLIFRGIFLTDFGASVRACLERTVFHSAEYPGHGRFDHWIDRSRSYAISVRTIFRL